MFNSDYFFRDEAANSTLVYVPTTAIGYTVDEYVFYQSVATMAHTDNYKLPRVPSTRPTLTQNKATKSLGSLVSQSWPWFKKYQEQFCPLSLNEALKFSSNEPSYLYWRDLLNCIHEGIHQNTSKGESSIATLKVIICDLEDSSNTQIKKVLYLIPFIFSRYFLMFFFHTGVEGSFCVY